MRVWIVALLFCLTACEKKKADSASESPPAVSGPPVEVQFPRSSYTVGFKEGKSDDMFMQLTFEPEGGGKVKFESKKHSVEHREVLATDASGVITKVKIRYDEVTESEGMAGKTKDKPSPLAGKTYIASPSNGELEAMHEDGTPLDAAEMEELVDDLEHLGTADPMDEIVAGKTWKSGVKVAFTADELARINNQPSLKKNDPSTEELTAMELTLLALEDGIARFHMVMKVKLTNPKGDMAMTIKGTVRVSAATGRPVELSGTGPIEGSMQGMKLTGTATIATKAL